MAFNHVEKSFDFPLISAITQDSGIRHYVTPENKYYPSVTTVLSWWKKDVLEAWANKIGHDEAERIKNAAAARGTALHHIIEAHLQNQKNVTSENQTAVRLFNQVRLKLKSIDNIVAQEIPLWSDALGIAGCCDCIAEWENTLSVIDFKSTLQLKKKDWIEGYFMQVTGYSLMWEERTGQKIEDLVIILSGEDMSVSVQREKRSNWIDKLKKVIADYKLEHSMKKAISDFAK